MTDKVHISRGDPASGASQLFDRGDRASGHVACPDLPPTARRPRARSRAAHPHPSLTAVRPRSDRRKASMLAPGSLISHVLELTTVLVIARPTGPWDDQDRTEGMMHAVLAD